jgi:hypothetical protein
MLLTDSKRDKALHLYENAGFNGGVKPDLLPHLQRNYEQDCYKLDTFQKF